MLVMISPLKSSFPQTRLQELACRCHRTFINLHRPIVVYPRDHPQSFLGHISCTTSCELTFLTQRQNSGTFCSFYGNLNPVLPNLLLLGYAIATQIASVPQTCEIAPALGPLEEDTFSNSVPSGITILPMLQTEIALCGEHHPQFSNFPRSFLPFFFFCNNKITTLKPFIFLTFYSLAYWFRRVSNTYQVLQSICQVHVNELPDPVKPQTMLYCLRLALNFTTYEMR